MNLLLIDDEPLTVQMLRKNMPWSSLGIDGVYTAYDTGTAREILASVPIHIILCDIEMPGESGIDFIKWLQDYPDCDAVSLLLTCHDEFHYAREAVSLDVMEYVLKPVPYEELGNIIRRAVRQYEEKQAQKKQLLAGQMWQQYIPQMDQELASGETDDREQVYTEVMEYVKQHIRDDIGRNDIAEAVHMNVDYLSRLFKKKTGISLGEYIRTEKLNYSRYLLKNTGMSLSEISNQLCFSSQSHFSNAFKKEFGISPAEFRMYGNGQE